MTNIENINKQNKINSSVKTLNLDSLEVFVLFYLSETGCVTFEQVAYKANIKLDLVEKAVLNLKEKGLVIEEEYQNHICVVKWTGNRLVTGELELKTAIMSFELNKAVQRLKGKGFTLTIEEDEKIFTIASGTTFPLEKTIMLKTQSLSTVPVKILKTAKELQMIFTDKFCADGFEIKRTP